MKYNFNKQLTQGLHDENVLDKYFSSCYTIYLANEQQQRQGIDRIFYSQHSENLDVLTIEYKSCRRGHITGNAFIETISVKNERNVKHGWGLTCKADFIIYFLAVPGMIFWLKPAEIRTRFISCASRYPERDVYNEGYVTRGLLVPLVELESIAKKIEKCFKDEKKS